MALIELVGWNRCRELGQFMKRAATSYRQIAAELRRPIHSGALAPGDRQRARCALVAAGGCGDRRDGQLAGFLGLELDRDGVLFSSSSSSPMSSASSASGSARSGVSEAPTSNVASSRVASSERTS